MGGGGSRKVSRGRCFKPLVPCVLGAISGLSALPSTLALPPPLPPRAAPPTPFLPSGACRNRRAAQCRPCQVRSRGRRARWWRPLRALLQVASRAKKRASRARARGPPGTPCHLRSPTLASALASVKRDHRDSRGKPSAGTFQGREGHVSPPNSGTHPSHKMPHCVHQRTGGGARMGASRPATRYTGTVACHGRFRDSECLVAVLFGAYWVAPLLRLAAGCPAQPCALPPPPVFFSRTRTPQSPGSPICSALCEGGSGCGCRRGP